MGEGSNTPMNVYISKDGQSVLLGKADSIKITEESVCPVQGTIKGNEVELMNLSYLGTTSSLTINMELDEFNADLLLEVCTPQMREVDYRFVLGTLFENEFSWIMAVQMTWLSSYVSFCAGMKTFFCSIGCLAITMS